MNEELILNASMTFLEKFEILKKSIPVPAVTIGPYTVDCEYVEYLYRSKNCYFILDGFYLEDCLYIRYGAFSKILVDCGSVFESEKCYESIDSNKCYSCTYVMDCYGSTDCHFSALLNACTNCFGCVGLSHKKFCILNKQYTKEEYLKEVERLKKENPEKLLAQMLDLKQQIPHPANRQSNTQNSPYGNYIYDSKNCYWCFNTLHSENSGYTYYHSRAVNCWDMYRGGGNPETNAQTERCYENTDSTCNYECAFVAFSDNCSNCYYSYRLVNCTDCFGCVGLNNKKYCILNNQLTKEQYEKTVLEFKKELGWMV